MLTLRPTTPEDLPRVTAWEAEPDTAIWLGEIGPPWHLKALADPDQEHLIAEASGPAQAEPVGFVVLAGLRDGAGQIELRRIVLAPAHRGAGRGRALLRAGMARAYERHGASAVWLDVKPHNHRALALYESEGFTVTRAVSEAIAEPDGSRSDLLIMNHPGPDPEP